MKTSEIEPQSRIPVATLEACGVHYNIILPQAGKDHIQQAIIATGRPYEFSMLKDMHLRLRPGELVLDIGAHIGNHGLYLAAVAQARVIAFEPNPVLCAAMEENIAQNRLEERVSVRRLALGAGEAMAHFDTVRPENMGSQALALGKGEIQVVALDSLEIDGPVRMMKIDVEGMELQVLQGGRALIARDRPILYIESQDEGAFRLISGWAQAEGYACWETFNATPTHLFLPAETVGLDQRLERLSGRAVIQEYRGTERSRRNREARAEANAEIRRLKEEIVRLEKQSTALQADIAERDETLAALERENTALQAHIAERDRSLAALEREKTHLKAVAGSERRAAADAKDRHARQLKAMQRDLAGTRAELAKTWKYGRNLEAKYIAILESETWRAMEPLRRVLRGLKGRPAPAAFVPRLTDPVPALSQAPVHPVQKDRPQQLIAFDAAQPRSDTVTVFLATYPAREGNLPQVVNALLPQCDVLNVYLNEYDHVPECLNHEKIQVSLGKEALGDIKDNGKFYSPKYYPDGFHIFADDDLIYPPDYTSRIIDGIRQFGYRTVVGFHGTIYEHPLESYIKDRTVLPFYAASRNTFVDQLGTGTIGYHTSTMAVDVAEFETTGSADLWFAKSAAEKGVPLVALGREANWLRSMKEIGDTLFRQAQRDDSRETALLRNRLEPALGQSPRTRALSFLRSIYTDEHLESQIDLTLSASGAFGTTTRVRSDIHFALIVTGWNCKTYVEPCLNSIERQISGGYTLDIYIYDDGSTDETQAKLRARSDVLNLKLFGGEANMGPAFARDFLLRKIDDGQDICVLLDMDDQLLPSALLRLEETYRAAPQCWMTYGNWVNQSGIVNEEGIYAAEEIDTRAYRQLDIFKFTHLRSFRRFLYDKVEPAHLKDENGDWLRHCSDVGLMLPIADQCASHNVVALTEPVYLYNQYRPTGTQRRFGSEKKQTACYLRQNPTLFRYSE